MGIFDYFQNLFSSEAGLIDETLLNTVKPIVTGQMNDLLVAPYTREEVKKALFQIGDMKAPAPMGFMPYSSNVFGISLERN